MVASKIGLIASLLLASSEAYLAPCAVRRAAPRAAARVRTRIAASASDVLSPLLSAQLLTAHTALFTRVADALRDGEEAGGERACEFELGGGATGSMRGFEATERRVAWASSRALRSAAACSGELSCWPTPAVEVPALFVRTAYEGEGGETAEGQAAAPSAPALIRLEFDFRPRLDGAWERAGEAPQSREAFSAAALRGEYDALFFTEPVRQWREGLRALPGVVELGPPAAGVRLSGRRQFGGEEGGAAGGPLALALGFPPTASGAAAASSAAGEAVGFWLGWLENARAASWMRNRLQYTRDCQLRAALYAAAARELGARYGAAGLALAAAEQGRQDMWGHNLMQEQSAFGHDGADGEGRD